MMRETGTVVAVPSGEIAEVLCPKSAFCFYGKALGIRTAMDRRHMQVKARNIVGAEDGDRVRLVVKPGRLLIAVLLLYGLPLAGLVVGAVVGMVLDVWLSIDVPPNLLAALLGVALMAGAFTMVRIAGKVVPLQPFMPELVEILPAEELLEKEYRNGD
jgi:sigma-E factor negative regulatory protein RseC